MKRIVSLILAVALCLGATLSLDSCKKEKDHYVVGIIQLAPHEALDAATRGFKDALTAKLEAAGKSVEFKFENAQGDSNTCNTIVNTFVSSNVDLIMANATAALAAAYNATSTIPILGTSITEYGVALNIENFNGTVGGNVSGTSDLAPLTTQAQMMIDTLGLKSGDKVGVIYCSNESNSLIQYNAVKALFEAEGITATAYTFSSTNELSAIVTQAASDCKAIYVPSDNTVANNDTVVGTICSENNIPVYTSYSSSICYASLAIDYYDLGYKTGEMAADILLGNKAMADVSVATLTPSVVYNEEICAALGITVPSEN